MTRPPVETHQGDQLAGRSFGPITQTDIIRFAGAGGDFNPLHHDETYARRAGLPGVISIGQMQAGLLAGWVSDLFHVEHLLYYSVRFSSPLFVGDVLLVDGEVTELIDGDVAELTLRGTCADRTVITGRARVRVATASS